MRHRHVFLYAALVTFCCAAPARPADNANAQPATPAADLQQMREDFIRDFQRIGLNTAPGDAAFLRIMVEVSGAKRGVEIGTATGYGAILMGLGFERNGGHLTTIDIDPKMVAAARDNLQKVRLDNVVTVVDGDALEVIPKLEGEFDFVFIDAVKKDYLAYFKGLEPKFAPGALIIADNVIKSADAMRDFLDLVQNSPDYRTTIIRASEMKGDGMAVIYKLK